MQEKCAIAARHDNDDVVAESWLVVSAGLPRWGAAASTLIVPGLVRTDDLNALCHAMLGASRFERVYLVLHMGSVVVYGWDRRAGWQVIADPDAGARERLRASMNDLIFNRIPAYHGARWNARLIRRSERERRPHLFHAEACGRQRPQQRVLADQAVEPVEALIAAQHRHLAIMIGCDIGIRLDGQDRIGLGPVRAWQAARSRRNRTSRHRPG